MQIPVSDHTIVFTFDPQSIKTTNTLATISVIIIYLMCALAVAFRVVHLMSERKNPGNGHKEE